MNRQWMRDQLSEFIPFIDKQTQTINNVWPIPQHIKDLSAELRRREPGVKKVLERLDPKLAEFDLDKQGGDFDALCNAQRGLGILDAMDDWAVHLAPDAPTLPADQFHPWVWDAARTYWDSEHFRAAVDAAATAINAHTQTKIGRRDIFDTDLMNQVFTDKPKAGQAYLQLPGDLTDQTIKSRNRALRPFAEGCFAGIRNPAAHEHGPDWDQQTALEYLAALSILARWIADCVVRHAA